MRKIQSLFTVLGLLLTLALAVSAQTNLRSLDGSTVNVEGQRGKIVVLSVGASWLPLSSKQADFTNALAKKYAGKDVVVYFIATDSLASGSKNFASNEALQKFSFDNKLNVSVLRDPDGVATLKRFKLDQVPSFVILDKNGVAIGEPFGGIDPKYDITIPISRVIDKIL
jgi:hypothetical protein